MCVYVFFQVLRRETLIVYPRVQLESLEHSLSTYKRGTYMHNHAHMHHMHKHIDAIQSLAASLWLVFEQQFVRPHLYNRNSINPSLLRCNTHTNTVHVAVCEAKQPKICV